MIFQQSPFCFIQSINYLSYQFITCINSFMVYFYDIFKNSPNMKIYYILLSSYSRSIKVFAITIWNLIFDRLWKRKTVGIDQFGESVKYLRQTQPRPTNIQRSFLWKINIVEEKFIAQFRLIFEKGISSSTINYVFSLYVDFKKRYRRNYSIDNFIRMLKYYYTRYYI